MEAKSTRENEESVPIDLTDALGNVEDEPVYRETTTRLSLSAKRNRKLLCLIAFCVLFLLSLGSLGFLSFEEDSTRALISFLNALSLLQARVNASAAFNDTNPF